MSRHWGHLAAAKIPQTKGVALVVIGRVPPQHPAPLPHQLLALPARDAPGPEQRAAGVLDADGLDERHLSVGGAGLHHAYRPAQERHGIVGHAYLHGGGYTEAALVEQRVHLVLGEVAVAVVAQPRELRRALRAGRPKVPMPRARLAGGAAICTAGLRGDVERGDEKRHGFVVLKTALHNCT
jgi:hypothetical protein